MWIELFANFLTFFGPLFLRYYPFRSRLRVPAWVIGLFVALVWGGVVAALLVFGYSGPRTVWLYRGITFVIFFISSCFFIRDRFVKHFFVYLICYTFMAVCIGIAQFVMVRTGGGYPAMIMATLVFDLVTYPFIFLFFRRVLEPVMDIDNTRIWNIIWVPPLLSCFLISVATPGMLDAQSVSYVAIRTLLGISSLATCSILVIALGHVREQARREAELTREREVSAMKQNFLHDLSHELQVPVTVVSGFAQLTGEMMDDPDIDRAAVRDNMRRVDSEAGRMERLVRQLLDAAAMENGSFTLNRQAVDLVPVLENAAKVHFPVLDGGGNTLRLSLPQDLPPVDGDRERLLQVVLNLLTNAAKHTRNGQITLSAQERHGQVEVAVADTGEGISPEAMSRLFKRYAKGGGPDSHGLGLYIADQIVKAHGGQIAVVSAPGKGTTVRLTLPVMERRG
ncbi:HAMP domain-containing sensor histidine kinase [Eubacterium sp. 1001713B170207_170306_E7]|uniref:sensor histidine kinase n=1 Tax=Eubacterium sp. 1001713B170207_170306_E7 TaxID=2787097 RepID=UPI00189BA473|nr:HAMP domain-containing sensor histidine kinase [Eubacterium sp. 1001713B170207_170306_E7]